MKTKCEEVKINLPEYIDKKLDEAKQEAISSHLEGCDSCRALHAELSSFLTYLDNFPEPEPPLGMKEEFMEMAAGVKIPGKRKTLVIPLWIRVAAMLILFFGTYWVGHRVGAGKAEMATLQLSNQLHEQKQQVMLATLKDYTGPQKIEAVYNISQSGQASDELINALVYTMNSDKNVNVRLAAINALSEMMDKNERVKTELIRSLRVQENSLLQISLIQVLTESGVKEAKDEIESMTNSEKTDETVKAFAKDMVKIII
jgi:hypothetical protein